MERTKIYKIIFSLFGFILMLSGVSYAYFITKVSNNETTSTITADAANLELEFKEGTNQISASDIFPGWYDTKTFSVTNKSSIGTNYSLYIGDIVNPLIGDSLSYKIESLDGGFNKNKTLLPSSEEVIGTGIYIQGNTTHTYTVTTYYNNLDIDQSVDKGKSFSYEIYIKGASTTEYIGSLVYDYTGTEQTFTAMFDGLYRLEVWGAQGGSATSTCDGGSGGYSRSEILLLKNSVLYVNVGGTANCSTDTLISGGYNGGASAKAVSNKYTMCAGGGATSIAKNSGELYTLQDSLDQLLIVAGGGGGSGFYSNNNTCAPGGSGGGIEGAISINTCHDCGTRSGGNQLTGGTGRSGTGSFGKGIGAETKAACGGGGGFYGGAGDTYEWGASGGSGYIGNSLLTNKVMYCYNCSESADESTKTISTTCTNETPTSNCSKKENGYARITYIES